MAEPRGVREWSERGRTRRRRVTVVPLVGLLLLACTSHPIDLGLKRVDAGEPSTASASRDLASSEGLDLGSDGLPQVPADLVPAGFQADDDGSAPSTVLEDEVTDVDQDPDPEGYPAGPAQTPPWCDSGTAKQERCGSDMDEDCDGMVDEYALLDQPCYTACDTPGRWLCDQTTQQLVCFNLGCHRKRDTCGNGFRDWQEPCDVSAGDPARAGVEPLQTYCREDCRWDTRFEGPCWRQTEEGRSEIVYFRGGLLRYPCQEAGLVCSDMVRSCVPKLGEGGWYRCPRLRRPESDEDYRLRIQNADDDPPTYPVIESEEGECHISCSTDAECPPALGACYMGSCVIW